MIVKLPNAKVVTFEYEQTIHGKKSKPQIVKLREGRFEL
jgi:hypothetical protein